MKKQERDKARELRAEGKSIQEIVSTLGVSKASVSVWVRDIALTAEQRKRISEKGRSVESIEKRRESRIGKTRERRNLIMDEAAKEVGELSSRELFLVGTTLYWGEGGKTEKGMARLANADPVLIRTAMRFFREICEVKEERFRGHVHTFSHLNAEEAEIYWSSVSGIPREQFYKTYSKPSVATKGKKDSTPYGTFQIYVCDTNLFYRIKGWIKGLGLSVEETINT